MPLSPARTPDVLIYSCYAHRGVQSPTSARSRAEVGGVLAGDRLERRGDGGLFGGVGREERVFSPSSLVEPRLSGRKLGVIESNFISNVFQLFGQLMLSVIVHSPFYISTTCYPAL